jgi:hypothetical protein
MCGPFLLMSRRAIANIIRSPTSIIARHLVMGGGWELHSLRTAIAEEQRMTNGASSSPVDSENAERVYKDTLVPTEAGAPPGSPEAEKRLFDHGLHEDKLFNDRLSFFLLFESLLLNVVVALYRCGETAPAVAFLMVAIVGSATSVIWLYVQRRMYIMMKTLVPRMEAFLPELKETRRLARGDRRGLPSMHLLTYFVPGIVLALWLVILAFAIDAALNEAARTGWTIIDESSHSQVLR